MAGALTNDSGPLLFVVAVFVLGVVTAYLQGAPTRAGRAGALHSKDASTNRSPDAPARPAHVA